MPARVSSLLLLLLLAALFSAGCQATSSARLSGQASMQASGAKASGSLKAQGSASVAIAASTIRLVRDKDQYKLDYKGTIRFAYDQARLEGDETFQVLGELRDILKKYPRVKITIEGHTDSRGSEAHNKQLSQRRAESIRNWLGQHGIDTSRLEAIGRGEDDAKSEGDACHNKLPKDTAPCEEKWAESRRAVFSVTAGAESIAKEEVPPRSSPDAPDDAPETPPSGVRRWYLGGHVGLAHRTESDPGFSSQEHVFLGPDIGLWLSPRWSLGLTGDLAADDSGANRGRALLWLEAHSSVGPGPELWIGAGVGAGLLPPRSDSSPSASFALRLGVDFHASPATRLGPFAEVASRQEGPGWVGLGFRLAHDFF